jgi:hypothetical protein
MFMRVNARCANPKGRIDQPSASLFRGTETVCLELAVLAD